MEYKIDSIDRGILKCLQKDARMAFTEIANKLGVSGGTIHQRVKRLEDEGILLGTTVRLNNAAMGMKATVLIGIHLRSARDSQNVIEQLRQWKEVVEVLYTTGSYALFIKVIVEDVEDFHKFLVRKLQKITEVQSTESFVCLDQPILRGISI